MEFPIRVILAASNAAHRLNGGFVKKYDTTEGQESKQLHYFINISFKVKILQ